MNLIETIRNRGPLWLTVHGGLFVLDRFIEYYLYPVSILGYGLVYGTGLMMALSFVLCLALLALYDWIGDGRAHMKPGTSPWVRAIVPHLRDALGFETLKETLAENIDGIVNPMFPSVRGGVVGVVDVLLFPFMLALYVLQRFVMRPLWLRFPKTRTGLIFFNLSIFTDPMTTLILLRPANHFVMGGREWKIFLGSVVIGCSGWAILVWLGIESYLELWPILRAQVVGL